MAGVPRGRTPSTSPQGQAEGRYGTGFGLGNYVSSSGQWEPTVLYLLGLIVAEFVAYCALRYAFKGHLGG